MEISITRLEFRLLDRQKRAPLDSFNYLRANEITLSLPLHDSPHTMETSRT